MIQFDTMNRFDMISEAKITTITNFWCGVSTIDHKFFEVFCHQYKIELDLKKFLEGILRKMLWTVLTYFTRRFPIFTYVWGTEIDSIDREWKGNVRIPIAEIKIMTVGRILNFHFYYPRLGTQLLLQYNRIYIIFR